jgi:hypothetical protein
MSTKAAGDTTNSTIVGVTQAESLVSGLLQALSSGILPKNSSAVLKKLTAEDREYIFSKDVKFSEKVLRIKNYLREPNKSAMVLKLPTHDAAVVRFPAEVFELMSFLYGIQCVLAIFPQLKDAIRDVIGKLNDE